MPLEQPLRTAKSLRSVGAGSSTYAGRINSGKPEQYYKFRLNRSSSFDLSLSGLKSDADLALLDRKGKMLGQSNRNGRLNEAISRSLDKGVYYVKVSRQRGSTRYRLNMILGNSSPTALGSPWQSSQMAEQVLALTNAYRQQSGLPPLRLNANLNVAAQSHAEDMAFNDFFGHVSSNGMTVFDRIRQTGYDYALAAENIAVGYATPNATVQGWINSPGHRANLLYPDLQEVGIGFYFLPSDSGNANYRYYWAQDFGTPNA